MPLASDAEAPTAHLLIWRGLDALRTEVAHVYMDAERLTARGTSIGVDPVGYELRYRLVTGARFVTAGLEVEVTGAGWSRSIELRREASGAWTCSAEQHGEPQELAEAGGDPGAFAEALDCDLGLCPLTNTMPVLRSGLLGPAGPQDFVMAWVSVPDLAVSRSVQRYEHIEHTEQGSRVRYVGEHRGFVGELSLDKNGFVTHYPELAERIFPNPQ